MKISVYDSLTSTNTFLRENPQAEPPMTLVCAHTQSAGRGQRGNSWESEPKKNLTCSFLFHPHDILPRQQFAISEAVALAVADTLNSYGIRAAVKWPNDIYCGEKKICGILIEHAVSSAGIERTIAGIGLNINQLLFVSDAPNPVSMTLLTDRAYDVMEVAETLGGYLEQRITLISGDNGRAALHADYMRTLWRGDGREYPFRLKAGNESTLRLGIAEGACFEAAIADIGPTGHLTLRHSGAELGPFAFKEIEFLPGQLE